MNCILAFLIFSGVIATGNALECLSCELIKEGATSCDGEKEQCDEGVTKCATQIEYNDYNGRLTTVRRRCLPANDGLFCGNYFKLDSKTLNITLFTVCCETDGCNKDPIQMPEDDTTLNGHECPTCFAEDSLTCDPTKLEPCVGNQLQCIEFSGSAARPGQNPKDYGIRGCVTKYTCLLDLGGLAGTRVYSKNYQCT